MMIGTQRTGIPANDNAVGEFITTNADTDA